MLVKNGNNIIAIYNNSFLEIDTKKENEIFNSIFKSDKKYQVILSDITITISCLYKVNVEYLQFKIDVNNLGTVSFHDLERFCKQEDIHDFDIFFNTVLKRKLLIHYNKQEQDFFIKHFKINENLFSSDSSVYIENGKEYHLYTQKFITYNSDYCTYFDFEDFVIYPSCQDRILNVLSYSNPISKSEYYNLLGNNAEFIYKNEYDTYYLYLLHIDNNKDLIYIHVRDYYIQIDSEMFEEFFDKKIVQSFYKHAKIKERDKYDFL